MTRMPWGQARRRRCAQCWGPVVLMGHAVPGQPGEVDWRVECLKGCQPGGHISETTVEAARERDLADYYKVIANYPELAPPPLAADELRAIKTALWGEERR